MECEVQHNQSMHPKDTNDDPLAKKSKPEKKQKFWRILSGILIPLFRVIPSTIPRYLYLRILRKGPLRNLTHNSLRRIIKKYIRMEEGLVFLNPNDPVLSGALTLGIHERMFRKIFTSSIKNGDCVIDIGANIGYYTIIAAFHVGSSGTVIAFEPERENNDFLTRSVSANGFQNVITSTLAISDSTKEHTLFIDPNNKGKHSLIPEEGHEIVRVQTSPLPEILLAMGVKRHINVIKIDIEGWEAKAINGMKEILIRDHPELFFEFAPIRIQRTGEDPLILLTDLIDLGYTLDAIDERNRTVHRIERQDLETFVARFRGFDDYFDIHAYPHTTT